MLKCKANTINDTIPPNSGLAIVDKTRPIYQEMAIIKNDKQLAWQTSLAALI